MTLTQEDIKTMKNFFDELGQKISADTERKINTALVNIEREIGGPKLFEETAQTVKLRSEIQASEDNLKTVIIKLEKKLLKEFNQIEMQFSLVYKRFDSVDKVLDDLVEFTTRDLNTRLEDQDVRIKLLEQTKPTSI